MREMVGEDPNPINTTVPSLKKNHGTSKINQKFNIITKKQLLASLNNKMIKYD